MEVFDQLTTSLYTLANPIIILLILVGVIIGVIFGAIPGLTATTGIAIFTPITFAMGLESAMGFLLGIYCGGYYAGSIPAILIKTPGAPGNAATVLDGYPMSLKGQAGKALNLSVVGSVIGGIFSAIVLLMFAPIIGNFALKFGAPEYFAIGLLGLICVAGVSGGSLLKGMIGAFFGLIIALVGTDPIVGVSRFTFANPNLMGGVSLIAALVGFFAVSELLGKVESPDDTNAKVIDNIKTALPRFGEYWIKKWVILKSAVIGTIIGALPGTGPTVASWISYNEAKRSSKKPEDFGHGSEEGLLASETANNAVTGGALVPLLTLGVPGDTVTAVLLGALMIQGITPGPTLITDNYGIVATLLWMLILANIFMLIIGVLGSRLFPKVLKIPMPIMIPLIIVLCVSGIYAVNNSIFDVNVLLIIGIIGFFLIKFGVPIPPIILGLVLGPIIEPNLLRSLISSDMNPLIFFTRPISLSILVLTVVLLTLMLRKTKNIMDN